jgi:hypothetical protein
MRTLTKLALLALLAIGSIGCVVVEDNPPPPPPPPPPGPPTYRILPGASTIVAAGSQPGFGITANLGGSYRAVWTGEWTGTTYNNFTGVIYTPGSFTAIYPGCSSGECPLELGDNVSAASNVVGGGQQFTFDTLASAGIDGVDFVVTLEPVEFDLRIENAYYPNLVFFTNTDTGAVSNPTEIPFDLTTR